MLSQTITSRLRNAARDRAVQGVSALFVAPAAASGMHAAGLTPELNAADLSQGLLDGRVWLTLGLVALFGGLGGVVAELLSLHGRLEVPHRVRKAGGCKRSRLADPRYEVDLGVLSRVLVGATAALALLAVYAPQTATSLIVNALIAGSAGTGVLRMVQGRLLVRNERPGAKSEAGAAKPKLAVLGAPQTAAAQ
jgi:hypothetical protein